MHNEHSNEGHRKTRVALNARTLTKVSVTTRHRFTPQSPKQNRLLAALPPASYADLIPSLEAVLLPQGSLVYGPGIREEYLYFLTKGVVAVLRETEDEESIGTAIKGSEGVIGIGSLLRKSMLSRTIVLSDSYAYRVGVDLLVGNFKHVELLKLLQRYILTLNLQVEQAAVCRRDHSVEKRLCSVILSCLDRVQLNELTITHEQLCAILGMRLESLILAVEDLRVAGLINYNPGNINVIDRPGMEKMVCECYAVCRREYYSLHPVV